MAFLTFWKWVWGLKTEKEKMNLKGPSYVGDGFFCFVHFQYSMCSHIGIECEV
jgi:hypothetical protein